MRRAGYALSCVRNDKRELRHSLECRVIRNPVILICSGYRRSPVWRLLDFWREHQVFSYAFIKSSLEMPVCVQIVLNVEALILVWLDIVKGVLLPSGFTRSIEICSLCELYKNPIFTMHPQHFVLVHQWEI